VTLLQTNYESPAAVSTAAGVGDAAAGGATDSPPPQAAATAPLKAKDGGRTEGSARNGSGEDSVRHSDASRRPGVHAGRTYYVLIPVVVMALFWFNYVAGS
jgi:hypothetical protein